jgi:hypothetical protein
MKEKPQLSIGEYLSLIFVLAKGRTSYHIPTSHHYSGSELPSPWHIRKLTLRKQLVPCPIQPRLGGQEVVTVRKSTRDMSFIVHCEARLEV